MIPSDVKFGFSTFETFTDASQAVKQQAEWICSWLNSTDPTRYQNFYACFTGYTKAAGAVKVYGGEFFSLCECNSITVPEKFFVATSKEEYHLYLNAMFQHAIPRIPL